MPQHKKQHFVPQFYLKRFSPDGRKINVWHIRKQAKIFASIKNQCHKDYLYGDDAKIENTLSQIESGGSHIIKEIDNSEKLPDPLSVDHISLVIYLMAQRGRTLKAASMVDESSDKVEECFKKVYRNLFEKLGVDCNSPQFSKFIEDAVRFSLVGIIKGFPCVLDLAYKLIINKTENEFVVSDNPVVFFNSLFFDPCGQIGNCGITSKGLQIFFPISPRKLIVWYDNWAYGFGKNNSKVVEIFDPKDVTMIKEPLINSVFWRDYSLC